MNIEGKVALITGASRGIGLAIARELAKAGVSRLILAARSIRRLNQVANSLRQMGVEAIALPVDLTQSAEVSAAVAKAWRDYGAIDLLINCAGVAYQAPFLQSRAHQVQQEISTNLVGMYTITNLTARRMAARKKGYIVNVSSLMGKVAAPTLSTYCATKFAIVGFTRALRLELAPHGVQVMALLPTLTETDMVREMKTFRGVTAISSERVARTCVQGIARDASEVLVGWQSHLAVWCNRLLPGLFDQILRLSAPSLMPARR